MFSSYVLIFYILMNAWKNFEILHKSLYQMLHNFCKSLSPLWNKFLIKCDEEPKIFQMILVIVNNEVILRNNLKHFTCRVFMILRLKIYCEIWEINQTAFDIAFPVIHKIKKNKSIKYDLTELIMDCNKQKL